MKPTNGRPSTVQQNAAAATDIDAIMARHRQSRAPGFAPTNPAATAQPRFDNVSSMSYHEMLNFVTDNRSRFMTLPAKLRRKFNHDPYQMLRFLDDPSNRMEGVRLGLLTPSEDEYEALQSEASANRAAAFQRAQETLGQLNLTHPPTHQNPPKGDSPPSGGLPSGDK